MKLSPKPTSSSHEKYSANHSPDSIRRQSPLSTMHSPIFPTTTDLCDIKSPSLQVKGHADNVAITSTTMSNSPQETTLPLASSPMTLDKMSQKAFTVTKRPPLTPRQQHFTNDDSTLATPAVSNNGKGRESMDPFCAATDIAPYVMPNDNISSTSLPSTLVLSPISKVATTDSNVADSNFRLSSKPSLILPKKNDNDWSSPILMGSSSPFGRTCSPMNLMSSLSRVHPSSNWPNTYSPGDVSAMLSRQSRVNKASVMLTPEDYDSSKLDHVAVVFADLVGFTEYSKTKSEGSVVAVLNEIFGMFDDAGIKHSCMKIKTIGDCYMTTCGVLTADDDAATHAVEFGLSALSAVAIYNARSNETWQLRVGVHIGQCCGGMVVDSGAYDIWGDTVNTASRMESTGKPGYVHISKDVMEAIDENLYSIQDRGEIAVKGKGSMNTYYLQKSNTRRNLDLEDALNEIPVLTRHTSNIEISRKQNRYINRSMTSLEMDVDSTLRVLVAEDSKFDQALMKTSLLKLGVVPTIVENGEDAVKMTLACAFDLVIVDLVMPKMDGIEAVKAIVKTLPPKHRPVLVVYSACISEVTKARAFTAGIDYYLEKPLKQRDIARVVHAASKVNCKEVIRRQSVHMSENPSSKPAISSPSNITIASEDGRRRTCSDVVTRSALMTKSVSNMTSSECAILLSADEVTSKSESSASFCSLNSKTIPATDTDSGVLTGSMSHVLLIGPQNETGKLASWLESTRVPITDTPSVTAALAAMPSLNQIDCVLLCDTVSLLDTLLLMQKWISNQRALPVIILLRSKRFDNSFDFADSSNLTQEEQWISFTNDKIVKASVVIALLSEGNLNELYNLMTKWKQERFALSESQAESRVTTVTVAASNIELQSKMNDLPSRQVDNPADATSLDFRLPPRSVQLTRPVDVSSEGGNGLSVASMHPTTNIESTTEDNLPLLTPHVLLPPSVIIETPTGYRQLLNSISLLRRFLELLKQNQMLVVIVGTIFGMETVRGVWRRRTYFSHGLLKLLRAFRRLFWRK